jgi:nicotinate phosphoribosyltransferase
VKYTLKLSSQKSTYPARKQIFRKMGDKKFYTEDLVGCADEKLAGRPLLKKVMDNGKIIEKLPPLTEIQKKAQQELNRLPPRVKSMLSPAHFPVKYSAKLRKIKQKLTREIKREQGLL